MDTEQAEYFKQIGSDPEYWDDKIKTLQAIKRRKDPNFKFKCPCNGKLDRDLCTCDVWADKRKERLEQANTKGGGE
jgi:hypothetical protein